ncbi:unnamed protein product [Pleuronectes platessa]|uniref:Uncharacterized protein n=1 Tax=Pleuronectes platessa TaxID=8262 RepID=A0A9N7VB21_PLEPL|nr:unnamed protein product [Pleuronectes platessa]
MMNEIEEKHKKETADESEEEIEKELEGETLQEFDNHSDFEESPRISPDSIIQEMMKYFDEFIESERLRKIDLQKDLLKEGGARTALEVNVNSVKRDRSQLEENLKKERKEKEALPITLSLNQEQAQTSGQEATIEHMKAERADSRSGEDQQHHDAQQLASENKTPRSRLEDALHEKALARKQHQEDREACSRLEEQVKKEEVWFLPVNNQLEKLKKAPADREALMCDKETLSLQNNDITGKLEAMEAKCKETVSQKDNIIFKNQAIIVELRHSVDELTAHLEKSERKNAQTEDALIQQQKDADKLDNMTQENQQLASENKRLRVELEDALREIRLTGDAALSEQLVERDKLDSLTRENQQVASVNEKLRSELVDALRERHVTDISKQRTLDDLTEENNHLASKSRRLQGELEDALREMQLTGDAALSEQLVERDKLDSLTRENQQVASVNEKLRSELVDALRERHVTDISKQRTLDDLTEENHLLASKSKRLQGELEDAVREMKLAGDAALSEQLVERDKLDSLTRENQQVASLNEKLRSELEEACSRLEEHVKKEKARFLQVTKKLARLKRGQADRESLMYDKETCRMEKYITGKLEATEAKYDLLVQRDRAHPRRNEELLAQKDDALLKNQAIKLQYVVDDLRTQQSESKMKQAQLEYTLRQEQIQRAVLEERISNTASLQKEKKKTVHLAYALKTERAKSKRYSFELTEAKINQVKLQERQHLSPSLHNL